jgi:hypothetical protein
MANRALDSDRSQRAIGLKEAFDTHDRVELEQRERRGRIVDVDAASFELPDQVPGQRIRVDL